MRHNAAIFVVLQPGVIPAHFGINWPNFALGGDCDQMKMILHQDITMHFHPVALYAFSEIAQKLRPISIIPENLFPSISARHDVVDGSSKLNPRRSRHLSP